MTSSRSKIIATAAVAALAFGSAIAPAMARGERGHGGGFHGGGFHGGGFHGGRPFAGGGFRHNNWGHGGFGHHRNWGGAPNWGYARGGYYPGYSYGGYGYDGFGLGLGLTAGLIGGALAATASEGAYAADAPARTVEYCQARFKSYNPATGTYLGYDGLRHSCP